MASITQIPSSGFFAIRFRYGGKSYQRSLKTKRIKEALAIKGRVEETIILIERGRLVILANADPGTFILSDGKRDGIPAPIVVVGSVGQLFDAFKKGRIIGRKEDNTLQGEDRHIDHLQRIIGGRQIAQGLIAGDLQRYVEKRTKEKYRGKFISPDTVEKEIRTFRLIWNWAVTESFLLRDGLLTKDNQGLRHLTQKGSRVCGRKVF